MGEKKAEQSAEVEASPELCFATITDYETFPEWQRAAKAAVVLERYPDGLGKVVEFHIDLGIRELRYRLDYSYERPHRIWWDLGFLLLGAVLVAAGLLVRRGARPVTEPGDAPGPRWNA